MKEDMGQIPRIPSFLKLKIVLLDSWTLKVLKNHRVGLTVVNVRAVDNCCAVCNYKRTLYKITLRFDKFN